jgi:hypothetical protein
MTLAIVLLCGAGVLARSFWNVVGADAGVERRRHDWFGKRQRADGRGSDYFRTLGATTLAGREFDDRDGIASSLVAVVNQSFATRYFPGRDSIGARVRFYDGAKPGEWRTIVGVVSNIMQNDPTRQRFLPLVYLPFRQAPPPSAWFFARTHARSGDVMSAVRAEVLSLDPDLTLEQLSTLEASFKFIASRISLT